MKPGGPRQQSLQLVSKNGHALCSYSDPKSKNQEGRTGKGKKKLYPSDKVATASAKSPAKSRAYPPTWLTPFGITYRDRTDGLFNYPKAAKFLRPLTEAHPVGEVLAAWMRYLATTEVEFISVSRFAETYGHWAGTAPPAPRRRSRANEREEEVRRWVETGDFEAPVGPVVDVTPGGHRERH